MYFIDEGVFLTIVIKDEETSKTRKIIFTILISLLLGIISTQPWFWTMLSIESELRIVSFALYLLFTPFAFLAGIFTALIMKDKLSIILAIIYGAIIFILEVTLTRLPWSWGMDYSHMIFPAAIISWGMTIFGSWLIFKQLNKSKENIEFVREKN